jgi:recombinational DNA repair protein (RecF pathway)
MNTRICAVCGKTKPINQFGNGIKSSKNTCLECVKKAHNRDKPPKVNPIMEYLEELK